MTRMVFRRARLRHDTNLFAGYETHIAPKGTMVLVYGKSPFYDTCLCSIPGYSRDWHIDHHYLEFLDESN
mgnify:CR=1 FL=1